MYMYKLQWIKTDMLANLSFWSSNRLSLFIFVGLGTWCTTCKDSDRRDNDGSPVVAKEGHRAGQRAKVHLNKAMNQIKQCFAIVVQLTFCLFYSRCITMVYVT